MTDVWKLYVYFLYSWGNVLSLSWVEEWEWDSVGDTDTDSDITLCLWLSVTVRMTVTQTETLSRYLESSHRQITNLILIQNSSTYNA